MLTHRNLLSNALQARSWTPKAQDGKEIVLCVAPFFHAYGMTVGMNLAIRAGATMVLLPRFKADDVVKAIERYRPTQLPGIPTMYMAIMRAAGKHAEKLRSIKVLHQRRGCLARQSTHRLRGYDRQASWSRATG